MAKICIMTDSTADLPHAIAEQYGISVVPLSVIFGSEAFKDGIEISPSEFYQRLVQDPVLPRTSQPSPVDFLSAYQRATADGVEQIIVLTLSSALSGTYQSALLAKRDATVAVEVVDSAFTSLALGWMAIAAAQAAAAGAQTEEILRLVESIKQRTSLFFVVDTLEYLQRNGRIGKASALLGSLLSVKPILSLHEGVVAPVEKVRGSSRALERMISLAKARHETHTQRLHIGVLHAAAPQAAERLADQIRQELHPEDLIISELGSVLGTHVGPNTVGVTVVPW